MENRLRFELAWFLRSHRRKENLSLLALSEQIKETSCNYKFDVPYLSRLESGKANISEEKCAELLRFFNISMPTFTKQIYDTSYLKEVYDLLYYVCLSGEDKEHMQMMIDAHPHNAFISHLKLVQWIQKAFSHRWDEEFQDEFKMWVALEPMMMEEERVFFLCALAAYYSNQLDKTKACQYLDQAKKMNSKKYGMLVTYYEIYVWTRFNEYGNKVGLLDRCIKTFADEKNMRRYSYCLMLKAAYYMQIHYYDRAEPMYKELIEYYRSINGLYNLHVNLHNLGNLYMQQEKYDQAIDYYKEAAHYFNENDTYFDLAWCYYKNGNILQCRQTLTHAKSVQNRYPVFEQLIEWLQITLDAKYSVAALNCLLKIENNYGEEMDQSIKQFIRTQIAQHYEYHRQYDQACEYYRLANQRNVTEYDEDTPELSSDI